MADPAAARANAEVGWDLYRDAPAPPTRDALNALLEGSGHEPISGRTYGHYRKLARWGAYRYLPINQRDVGGLADPLLDRVSWALDHPVEVDLAVRLEIDGTGRSDRCVDGVAVEVARRWTGVRLGPDEVARCLDGADAGGRPGRLTFLGPGTERSGLVLPAGGRIGHVRVELDAEIDPADLLGADPGGVAVARLRVGLSIGPEHGIDGTANALGQLGQACGAIRSAVAALLDDPVATAAERTLIRVSGLDLGAPGTGRVEVTLSGPSLSLSVLVALVEAGTIRRDGVTWEQGSPAGTPLRGWLPRSEVKELVVALRRVVALRWPGGRSPGPAGRGAAVAVMLLAERAAPALASALGGSGRIEGKVPDRLRLPGVVTRPPLRPPDT